MKCDGCANEKTDYCLICDDGDFFRTQDEKAYEEAMCDLLCGDPEDDPEDCTEEWNKYYYDTRL